MGAARTDRRWSLPTPGRRTRWTVLVVSVALVADLIMSGFGVARFLPPAFGPGPGLVTLVLVVLMALALILSPRHPVAILAVVVTLQVTIALSVHMAMPVACLIAALYTAARFARPPVAHLVLPLGLTICLSAGVSTWQNLGGFQTGPVLFFAGFYGVIATAVWMTGRHERRLDERSLEFDEEVDVTAARAAAEERSRISYELHDILAHSVSAMMMQAAGAGALTRAALREEDPDPRLRAVGDALDTIEHTGAQSMRELHRLLASLRDEDEDARERPTHREPSPGPDQDLAEPSARPSLALLDTLVETPRRSGLDVSVHRSGEPSRLDPSVDAAAYRVAQEGLTNALKHAGRGARVDIEETWRPGRLQLRLRSRSGPDGTVPGTPGSGRGLVGLRQRVELVGGRFESGWNDDTFVVTAELPTRPARRGPRSPMEAREGRPR